MERHLKYLLSLPKLDQMVIFLDLKYTSKY